MKKILLPIVAVSMLALTGCPSSPSSGEEECGFKTEKGSGAAISRLESGQSCEFGGHTYKCSSNKTTKDGADSKSIHTVGDSKYIACKGVSFK